MKILLALTCYQCENQVGRVLKKLSTSTILPLITQIAIIDNRSQDNTVKNAIEIASLSLFENKAHVYLNDQNYGLGGSHKISFDLAKKMEMDYVIILHGDDQAEVDDLDKFTTYLRNETPFSALLGTRFSFKSKLRGYQKKRIFGNLILNALYTILTLTKITDLGSGLNLYSVKDLEKINYHSISSQFTFNVELMLKMLSEKMQIKFIPITWKEEDQQSNAKNFSVAAKMIKALVLWRFFKMESEINENYTTTLIK